MSIYHRSGWVLITSYISPYYYLHLHLPTSYPTHFWYRPGITVSLYAMGVHRATDDPALSSKQRSAFPPFCHRHSSHRRRRGHADIIIWPPRRRRRWRTRQITRECTSCGLQIHSHDTATASFRPSHCRVRIVSFLYFVFCGVNTNLLSRS